MSCSLREIPKGTVCPGCSNDNPDFLVWWNTTSIRCLKQPSASLSRCSVIFKVLDNNESGLDEIMEPRNVDESLRKQRDNNLRSLFT